MEKVLTYIEKNKKRQLNELFELLSIKSVSAQKEHNKDTLEAAKWLKNHLTKIGMENAKVVKTAGHPVVYADWIHAKDKPTVLIYGHYDVQAPDPLNEWKTDPFKPVVRNGNIYARGVADDKGQLFTHIKAIEALFAVDKKLPINVKFMIEGEEEVGGPNLTWFIKKYKSLLKADFCLISDSHSLSETQPLLAYGLRGLVYSQINLSVMPKDVHSGEYGGNIANAAVEVANIINKLKDLKTQKVLIPGFYSKVRKLSAKEKLELKKSKYNEKSVLAETGVASLVGVKGFSPAERMGAQPTLEVNGMYSGYLDEGAKTIIPAKASVKISMRLVPNQTAKDITEKYLNYLKKIIPPYVKYEALILSDGEPLIISREGVYIKNAEKVMKNVFGKKPIFELSGGSIPVTVTLKNILKVDSVLMGFGLPDDGLHSPNEKMSVEMFYKGIKCSAEYLKSFNDN